MEAVLAWWLLTCGDKLYRENHNQLSMDGVVLSKDVICLLVIAKIQAYVCTPLFLKIACRAMQTLKKCKLVLR